MTIEIIRLKQLLKNPNIPKYDEQKKNCDIVVKSEFELANFLAYNKKIPVVLESLYDNVNCHNSEEMCALARQYVFPRGLPNSFEQLTYDQKVMLYEHGAAITLTYMGILPKTYPSIDKDNLDKIDAVEKNLLAENSNLKDKISVLSNKAHFALENAKLAAQDYYGDSTQGKVFIIFKFGYDFNIECHKLGYTYSEADFTLGNYNEILDILVAKYHKLSEKLENLIDCYPSNTNKLIQSEHVNIKDLSDFAENNFEILKDMVQTGFLIDSIASGVLSLWHSVEVI